MKIFRILRHNFFAVAELDARIREHAMAAAAEEADAMDLLNDDGRFYIVKRN